MTTPKTIVLYLTSLLLFSIVLTNCTPKSTKSELYEHELSMVDSVRRAYQLSKGDSAISDFFMKEVRYKNFGVSTYRLEDSLNRHFLFGVLKNGDYQRIFPLTDNRLLEENRIARNDTTQLDTFLREVLRLNGKTTFNWYQQHQFIAEKILLPVLDLHEIGADAAENTLDRLKSDTTKILFKGTDCRPIYIKTYEYIVTQQKANAPKFFYKHPKFDSGLIYEMDFANPGGDFRVRYLNESCFFNYMY